MSHESVHQHLLSLLSQFSDKNSKSLVIADENFNLEHLTHLTQIPGLTILTNRFDLMAKAKESQSPIEVIFNDFDFSVLSSKFDRCIYRISKERPVCHHIFKQIKNILSPNGKLLLGGRKNEGVKNYHQKLCKNLGFSGSLVKNKDIYTATLVPPGDSFTGKELDDKDYPFLRLVNTKANTTFYSKPGLYGWNKIDQGSSLLMDCVIQDLQKENKAFDSVLDLGCGYGYLSMRLLKACEAEDIPFAKQHTATDNNAAALLACEKNLEEFQDKVTIDVIADDCAQNIERKFSLVICNPPFHQGFDNSRDLSEKFVTSTKQHLAPGGTTYFVVNVFIPVESLAQGHFKEVSTLENDGQFKVIRLR